MTINARLYLIRAVPMAFLSSARFSVDDDVLSEGEDCRSTSGVNDSLHSELAYSVGYSPPPSSIPLTLATEFSSYRDKDEEKELKTEYVAVEGTGTPSTKLSTLSCCQKDKRVYYKNVYMLSIAFLLLVGVHDGLVGIESTINVDVGLVTLAIENVVFVFSVIVAPAVIWLLGLRNTLLLACVLQIGYVCSNYIRSYFTLVPGAIIGGFSLAIAWVAANLYVSISANNLAASARLEPNVVLGKLIGIFYTFLAVSLLVGNLISSAVFFGRDEVNCDNDGMMPGSSNQSLDNSSSSMISNAGECSCEITSGIRDNTRYILISIFVFGGILSIVVLLFGVGSLPRLIADSDELRARVYRYLKKSVASIIKINFRTKGGLLIPLFSLEGLLAGYYLGTFTTVSELRDRKH